MIVGLRQGLGCGARTRRCALRQQRVPPLLLDRCRLRQAGIYEFLEAEDYSYSIRLPANPVLQQNISHLLTRPVGRPPNHV